MTPRVCSGDSRLRGGCAGLRASSAARAASAFWSSRSTAALFAPGTRCPWTSAVTLIKWCPSWSFSHSLFGGYVHRRTRLHQEKRCREGHHGAANVSSQDVCVISSSLLSGPHRQSAPPFADFGPISSIRDSRRHRSNPSPWLGCGNPGNPYESPSRWSWPGWQHRTKTSPSLRPTACFLEIGRRRLSP